MALVALPLRVPPCDQPGGGTTPRPGIRHERRKKHEDYGPKNIADSPGGAINGLRVRMHDKLARINNLFDSAREGNPQHESFEDSFKDMANYAIIGLLVLRGKWDN